MNTFGKVKEKPVSIRLSPGLRARLEKAADELGLSMNDIAKHAIRAGVDAIEAKDYRIEWPLRYAAAETPHEDTPRHLIMNDDPPTRSVLPKKAIGAKPSP